MKQFLVLFFLLTGFLPLPVHAIHDPLVLDGLVMADEPAPDEEEEEPDCD